MKFAISFFISLLTVTALHAEVYEKSIYEVPVNDPSLAGYAQFQLHSLVVSENKGRPLTVSYVLPPELTGHAIKVQFTNIYQDENGIVMTGEHGQMNCSTPTPKTSEIACQVKFTDLPIDVASRDAAIRAISANSKELAQRTQVANLFSGDPAGVLRYQE